MPDRPNADALSERVRQLEAELERLQTVEAALHESELKIRAIYDQTFQFIGLMEPDGTLIEANRSALQFAGIRESDVIGKPFWETPWWTHSPDLQRQLKRAVKRAAAGEFVRFEATHMGEDGQSHFIDFSLKPAADDSGRIRYLIPEGRDITERKRAEEALQRAYDQMELRVHERTRELARTNAHLQETVRDLRRAKKELLGLTAIIESTSDLVSTATPDGKLTYLNLAGRRMLGWGLDADISARRIPDIHPQWAYDIIREIGIPNALREGSWIGETGILTADGREIHVSQAIMAHKSAAGKLEYLSTIMRDITDRKSAEQFLDSIISAIADPIFVKDEQHRWVVVNKAFCDFLGFSRDELLYKTDYDFFPPEEADVFREKDEQVFRTGRENINVETVTDARGNSHVISTKKAVFSDHAGNRRLVGVIRDITELKQAERKLGENIRYLHSIVENLPVCVKLVNRKGTLVDMNPAGLAMLAVPDKGAVIGRSVIDFIADGDKAAFRAFNRNVCSGAKEALKFTMMDWNGSPHFMESVAVPITIGSQDHFIQLVITRDVTDKVKNEKDKQRLEKQLRQAQKMEAIGTLAGGIAHDFNNILSAIMGYTELAKLSLSPDSPLAEDLNQVYRAGMRAKDLITQILSFSRRAEREYAPQSIPTIARDALRLLRASIPTLIEFREELAADCGPVMGDATQIHQVLMNLCTNAYHAMRRSGGMLAVSVREIAVEAEDAVGGWELTPGRYVQLTVSDTGVGMAAELQDRVFEPYFTTKEKGEGTGLGLSVVHGIVQNHGGHISLYSAPGAGTTFQVYFPCIAEQAAAETAAAHPLPRGSEHILVVDDEVPLVQMLRRMLTNLGYSVTVFSESRAALEAFTREPGVYDMVVTDMTMPGMTGAELAREMIAIRPRIPIVLCTGFSEIIDAAAAEDMGIRKFLTKPLLLRELAEAIRSVLDAQGADSVKTGARKSG